MQNDKQQKLSGKRLLSVRETAKYLGISPKTVYNRISRKAEKPFPIKSKKFGGRRLFDIKDLEKFVDSL